MSEKIDGGILPNQEKEATKESVFVIVEKYLNALSSYKDDEQVVAYMGRAIVLDAQMLKAFILAAKKQVESDQLAPNKAIKALWNGNLMILKAKESKHFAEKVIDNIKDEIKELKKIVS